MKYLLNIVTFCSLILGLTTAISADILSYSVDSNFSNCDTNYNKDQLKVSYTDFNYDTETEQLTIEAEFNNTGGTTLANSFQLSFNSEIGLESSRYKYAYFYIDGSSSVFSNGNTFTPKISAFVANRMIQANNLCNNSDGSWVTNPVNNVVDNPGTEPILANTTGYNGNPSYVAFAEVSDSLVNITQKRKFTIILDGKNIQDNFIVNPSKYFLQEGPAIFPDDEDVDDNHLTTSTYYYRSNNKTDRIFDFGRNKKLSFDLLPSVFNNSSYSGSKLTALTINSGNCSRCRKINTSLNTAPTCTVSTSSNSILAGEELAITFQFTDPDSHSHQVNYTGLTSGITTTYAEGATITASDSKTITLNWTPKSSDVGNYTFKTKLTELFGHNQLSAECSVNIEVFAEDPVCTQTDIIEKREKIISNTNKLNRFLKKVYKQAKRVKKKKIEKTDFLGLIENYRTETLSAMDRVPGVINSCTENTLSCEQVNLLDEFKNAQLFGQTLYCKRSSQVPFCSILGNLGSDLLKLWKKGFNKKARQNGYSSNSPETLKFQKKYNKFKSILVKAAVQNFELTNELLDISTPKQHYICN